jgi:hypothetical protein
VYIFDKSSYSIVGVIKTADRLLACNEGKLLFIFDNFYTIQNILFPNIPDLSPYCKINPFKQAHLLSSPYLFPCGYSACLDCIYSHYNIFKRIFICPMCKVKHKLKLNQLKASDIVLIFNQDVCTTISDKLKSVIHDKGRILNFKSFFILFIFIFQDERLKNFENFFNYKESEIKIRIESLKEELNKKEIQLMKLVKKFELQLLQENNLKMETLSVKASF